MRSDGLDGTGEVHAANRLILLPHDLPGAYHALDSHIVGSALWLARIPPKEELDVLAKNVLRQLPEESYPDLVVHIQQHLSGEARGMRFFEFGLDLLLDGVERLRGEGRNETVSPR